MKTCTALVLDATTTQQATPVAGWARGQCESFNQIEEGMMFQEYELAGLEWQQIVAETTDSGKYRVEITWALDRYRVTVFHILATDDCRVEVVHPWHARTAIATANRLLRKYNRRAQ